MKTSAGLLSLALFLALPAAAQRAGSSSGSNHSSGGHASSGSSFHGASSGPTSTSNHGTSYGSSSGASSGSAGGSSGGSAPHSSYAASSAGYSAGAASRMYQSAGSASGGQAAGRYTGNAPATRSAAAMQRGFVRAPFVGSLAARVAGIPLRTNMVSTNMVRTNMVRTNMVRTNMFRATTQAPTVQRGPFFTAVTRSQPEQDFSSEFSQHFHHGFRNSFWGFPLGCGFDSFNCFGGSSFNPLYLPVGLRYDAGLNYAGRENGYYPGEQVVDASSYYEPASAPGTYVPDALTPAQPEQAPAPKPITLLELKDGTMYGVTDYWLDHGQLRYVASYGGENAVPLERVDLDKTVELNSAKGIDFVLRNAPSTRPHAAPTQVPLQPLAYPQLLF